MDSDVASPEIPPEPVTGFAGEVPTNEELAKLLVYFWHTLESAIRERRTAKSYASKGKPKKRDENLEYAERHYRPIIERIFSDPVVRLDFARSYLRNLVSGYVIKEHKHFQSTALAFQFVGSKYNIAGYRTDARLAMREHVNQTR